MNMNERKVSRKNQYFAYFNVMENGVIARMENVTSYCHKQATLACRKPPNLEFKKDVAHLVLKTLCAVL